MKHVAHVVERTPIVVVSSPKQVPARAPVLVSSPRQEHPTPEVGAAPPQHSIPRPRKAQVEPPAVEEPPVDLSSMSRKERHKYVLRQRLERQIAKINKSAPAPATRAEEGTAAAAGDSTDGEALSHDAAHVAEANLVPVRHDPKFVNGTFWRERKEKKKRTLFVGNLPARSYHKASSVIELIRSVFESSEEGGKLDCSSLVEHVDFLGQKLGSIVHHAYVAFTSLEAAQIAKRLLDGLPVESQKLRVNFSADKQMRTIAIKKRSGGR